MSWEKSELALDLSLNRFFVVLFALFEVRKLKMLLFTQACIENRRVNSNVNREGSGGGY